MCYIRPIAEIATRELRNDTRAVLARVEAGEPVTITVNGRAVAVLEPLRTRRRWVGLGPVRPVPPAYLVCARHSGASFASALHNDLAGRVLLQRKERGPAAPSLCGFLF